MPSPPIIGLIFHDSAAASTDLVAPLDKNPSFPAFDPNNVPLTCCTAHEEAACKIAWLDATPERRLALVDFSVRLKLLLVDSQGAKPRWDKKSCSSQGDDTGRRDKMKA
jgi:hypothetical protein